MKGIQHRHYGSFSAETGFLGSVLSQELRQASSRRWEKVGTISELETVKQMGPFSCWLSCKYLKEVRVRSPSFKEAQKRFSEDFKHSLVINQVKLT